MAKKDKLFGMPGQVDDELTLEPDADIFADGKPRNDTIVDLNAGDDRADGGAGDDLITYWHEANVG